MMASATTSAIPPGFIPASVEFGLRHLEYGLALFTNKELLA